MNRPYASEQNGGRRGIRTPGTVNPYVSLANWWFQPLTHPSIGFVVELPSIVLKCGAKVICLFGITKYFCNFFLAFQSWDNIMFTSAGYLSCFLCTLTLVTCSFPECLPMEFLFCPSYLQHFACRKQFQELPVICLLQCLYLQVNIVELAYCLGT